MGKKIIVLLVLFLFLMIPTIHAQVVRLPQEPNSQEFLDYSLKDNGFWCAVEGTVNSSIIMHHRNLQRAALSFVGGYRINEFIRFGAGLGADCYFNGNSKVRSEKSMFTLPVFFDIRGNMTSQLIREIVPYWSLDIGANVGDGFFFSPTIGMRIGEQRRALLLGLSYMVGKLRTTAPVIYPEYVNYLGFKIGYEF